MSHLNVDELRFDVPGRTLWEHVSLEMAGGTSLAIMGPSGSGKTTLLHCLCGISRPTSGTIRLEDAEISKLSVSRAATLRLRKFGMLFQFGELLPELTVLENVELPLRLNGMAKSESARLALESLRRVDLADRGDERPEILSGGEVQRVALARALVTKPAVLLADEPTGALDETNGARVAALLFESAREIDSIVIVATHNPAIARLADRVAQFHEQRIVVGEAPALAATR